MAQSIKDGTLIGIFRVVQSIIMGEERKIPQKANRVIATSKIILTAGMVDKKII